MRLFLFLFLIGFVNEAQAQYINIYLTDSTTESFALADVGNLTFVEDVMQMSFVGGSQLHWNTSIIDYIDYEDAGLGIGQPTSDLVQSFLVFPNPSSSFVNVTLDSKVDSEASVVIFNLNGQLVKNLDQGKLPVGKSNWIWNGENSAGNRVAPGMYLCTVMLPNQRVNRTIILTE